MVVLIVNAYLGVRRHNPDIVDAHGTPVPSSYADPDGPWPSHVRDHGDGRFALTLDPAAVPVTIGDMVTEAATPRFPGGREWLVLDANVARNDLDPVADHIHVTARIRSAGGFTVPHTPGPAGSG
jgi:hypothetical protein